MSAYHHGDLRRAALDRAVEIVAECGPAALSLRALSADLGVSHAAPRYHFGSNAGLLSAIAIEGFELLRADLAAVRESGAHAVELGVAYVKFAVEHSAHFAVMFEPTLLDASDEQLRAAQQAAFDELRRGLPARPGQTDTDAASLLTAAWALMHGLATLELNGSLAESRMHELLADSDIERIARRAGLHLAGSAQATPNKGNQS